MAENCTTNVLKILKLRENIGAQLKQMIKEIIFLVRILATDLVNDINPNPRRKKGIDYLL